MQKTPVEKTLIEAPAAVASSPVPSAIPPRAGDTSLRSDIPTAPADEAGGGSLPAYTAGPYSVRVRPAGIYSRQAHIVDGPNGFPLAILEGYSGYEREANAHLFAAAPTLVAAVQELEDAYAAEGRPGVGWLPESATHEWNARVRAAWAGLRAAKAKATGQ